MKKIISISLIIYLVIVINSFFSLHPNATNRYFSQSGNDVTGNGTQGNPYKTLAKLQSLSLSSNDSILFERGDTFSGTLSKSTSSLHFSTYGTGARPLILYSGSDPMYNTVTFNLSGSGITFNGLNFTNPFQDPDRAVEATNAIGVEVTGDGCSFIDCWFSKIGCGVFILNSDNNNFNACDFNDMRMIKSTPGGDDDYGANGSIIGNGNGNTMSNSTFDSCFAPSDDYGIDGGAFEASGPCSNNKFLRNTVNRTNGIMELGSGTGGTSADNLVAYCVITNCGELGYTSASGGFPVQCRNMQYYNNVIIDTTGGFGFSSLFNFAGSETNDSVYNLKNNIFYLKGGIDVVTTGHASKTNHENNYYDLSSGSSAGYSLNGSEANVNVQTQWINLTLSNYNLKSTASAIGAGQNLGLSPDYYQKTVTPPVSIGASQYVSPQIFNGITLPTIINGHKVGVITTH